MIKNLSVTGAIVVAVVFGVLYFKGPAVITVPQITQLGSSQQASPIVNVEAAKPVVIPAPIVNVNVPKQETKLGAVTGPDLLTPYFSFGGVRLWASGSEITIQGSTTPWAAQAPISTSTLLYAGCKLDVSSTTASTIRLSKATTQYATTTSLGAIALAANAKGTIIASTTVTTGQTAAIFEPNSWIVFSMQGGVGTFSPTGSCDAIWVQI